MPDQRSPDDSSGPQPPHGEDGPFCEEVQHSQISAVVPERVARGVFSTGAVVVQGPHEFILDFLLRMSQPQQVAARVDVRHQLSSSLEIESGAEANVFWESRERQRPSGADSFRVVNDYSGRAARTSMI